MNDDASCVCGYPCENVHNFFLSCHIYNKHRLDLFTNLGTIVNDRMPIELSLLLHGNTDLSSVENIRIFHLVQLYIHKTKRFQL